MQRIEIFQIKSQAAMLDANCSKMMQTLPDDPNELLRREVDNGFHDVAVCTSESLFLQMAAE